MKKLVASISISKPFSPPPRHSRCKHCIEIAHTAVPPEVVAGSNCTTGSAEEEAFDACRHNLGCCCCLLRRRRPRSRRDRLELRAAARRGVLRPQEKVLVEGRDAPLVAHAGDRPVAIFLKSEGGGGGERGERFSLSFSRKRRRKKKREKENKNSHLGSTGSWSHDSPASLDTAK